MAKGAPRSSTALIGARGDAPSLSVCCRT
jgi:hypothetical protein